MIGQDHGDQKPTKPPYYQPIKKHVTEKEKFIKRTRHLNTDLSFGHVKLWVSNKFQV